MKVKVHPCSTLGATVLLLASLSSRDVGHGYHGLFCFFFPGDGGSIPPPAVSKLRQFRSPHICLCLSEETLKAGGFFDLVSMPGEVKDPTQGVNV